MTGRRRNEETTDKIKIIETNNIDVVEQILQDTDTDSLVVFDCDDVLLTIADSVFYRPGTGKNSLNGKISLFDELYEQEFGQQSSETRIVHSAAVLATNEPRVVCERMPVIVRNLQNRGIKCIVATAICPHPSCCMSNPIEWRTQTLRQHEYNFETSFQHLQNKTFDDIQGLYQPVYNNGILYCSCTPKDVVLELFLKYAQINPQLIVFIDDSKRNIDIIGDFCKKNDIDYVGIYYTEARMQHDRCAQVSRDRSVFQMQVLKEYCIWLPDEIILDGPLCVDWVAFCHKSILCGNVQCTKILVEKIDNSDKASLAALAKTTGNSRIIEIFTATQFCE
ncbi:MAG: DUF2608 domain-containing protein [Holosporales bacterium]|jgi:hypothetical protein|nr:DUF2608 domain-containing protein [Holosporales bacterium]